MKKPSMTVPVECYDKTKTKNSPDRFAHFHDFPEILYLYDGEMNIWLNGNPYELCQGEMIIINSNECHRLESKSDVSRYFVIRFTPMLLLSPQNTPDETKYILPFFSEYENQPRVYKKEFIENSKIPALIYDALEEWHEKKPGYELALNADALKIIRFIIGFLSEKGINVKAPCAGGNIHHIMSDVLRYINENFRILNEKEVADRFGLSYSYFSRSFKHIMNMSFKEYINYLKINESQKIMLTSEKSISEISSELGFSSSSHFINVFRKYNGFSPGHYKKNISKG